MRVYSTEQVSLFLGAGISACVNGSQTVTVICSFVGSGKLVCLITGRHSI